MYIEMNNKLTFRLTIHEMTLLLVGEIWLFFYKNVAKLFAYVAVTMSDIKKKLYGYPQRVCLFVDIHVGQVLLELCYSL